MKRTLYVIRELFFSVIVLIVILIAAAAATVIQFFADLPTNSKKRA